MEKKLLLVDDEQDILDILNIYLSDMGFTVFSADDGLKGLDIFLKERPPVVVTDIRMPGIDGIDLLRRIKQEAPDTEVIMITGHGDLDTAVESLKNEASDFITKPINPGMLDVSVNRAYEKASMRARIRAHDERLQELVQEELRATRHKYHQLFEAAPCFISVQDRNFRITESNRLFQEHFGESGGRYCYSVYKHRDEPCGQCPVAMTFEDERSHQIETVVTAKSGKPYNVLITTAPIRNKAGKVTHVMEMSTDITRIRELQDHLTSLGLLIGSVSHGIKGLLTGLDGGMYLLKSGFTKENREQIEEGWDIVRLMAGRIRKQVLDILYYAKNRELDYQWVDVGRFSGDLAVAAEAKADGAEVRFERNFVPDLGDFEVDVDVLSSAMVNILENAVDACADKKTDAEKRVVFSVSANEEEVLFSVRDNGIGMNRETREKIFTLFFSSKGTKGTGLGLFIANKMVGQHGGVIEIESEYGKGSRFLVRVPRSREAVIR